MITVTLDDEGNLILQCGECPQKAVIPFALSASPFWNIHVGDPLLIMVGHVNTKHSLFPQKDTTK